MKSPETAPAVRLACFVMLMECFVISARASDYDHAISTLHSSGVRASSVDYTADLSSTPGLALGSADYLARTGHSGQLYDPASLEVQATPLSLNETSTRQLSAVLRHDDETSESLNATSVTWSIQSGPLASISSQGLATGAAVYQDTAAIVHAAHAGISGTLSLTVFEAIADNFGLYAGDRMPDVWQVRFLGLNNPLAGPAANPDGDAFSNLLELAFGTDPAIAASGPGSLLYSGGLFTQRGQPSVYIQNIPNSVDFRAVFGRRKDYLAIGLRYEVQFSGDLITWQPSAATPSLLASDSEMDAVSVPYPFFVNGVKARFFRVSVDFDP